MVRSLQDQSLEAYSPRNFEVSLTRIKLINPRKIDRNPIYFAVCKLRIFGALKSFCKNYLNLMENKN